MDDQTLTRADGYPCQGQLLSGEPVHGILILRYSRRQVASFAEPVGAGMTRWCELEIEGVMPEVFTVPVGAMLVSERLGERVQIEVTPERATATEAGWRCEGPYELQQRWKLP